MYIYIYIYMCVCVVCMFIIYYNIIYYKYIYVYIFYIYIYISYRQCCFDGSRAIPGNSLYLPGEKVGKHLGTTGATWCPVSNTEAAW